jgi:hypothetical protein
MRNWILGGVLVLFVGAMFGTFYMNRQLVTKMEQDCRSRGGTIVTKGSSFSCQTVNASTSASPQAEPKAEPQAKASETK